MLKIIAVDFYDLIWQQETLFSEADIDRLFRKYAEHRVDAVLWRLSVCGKLLYRSQTADCMQGNEGNAIDVKCGEILRKYDPAEAAVAAGRKYGIEVFFWLTLFDDAGYSTGDLESSFCREHPEFSWRSRDGKDYYHGVLSYVYPEVREFRMRQIREILAYGGAGLYLCNRSHSRSNVIRDLMRRLFDAKEEKHQFQSKENQELNISEFIRCRGEYGFDPPAVAAYTGDLQDQVAWQRFRGTYFTEFMRQVRKEVPTKLWFGLRYGPIPAGTAFVYGDHFFDWEKFSDGTLVDAIGYYLQPPDFDDPADYPEFYRPTNAAKLLWMSLSNKNPDKLLEAYHDSLQRWIPLADGLILFEAYQLTDNPEYWQFLDELP